MPPAREIQNGQGAPEETRKHAVSRLQLAPVIRPCLLLQPRAGTGASRGEGVERRGRLHVHPGFQQEAARSFHAGEDLLIGQVWRFDEYLGQEVLVTKLATAPARVVTQGQGNNSC